MTSEPDSAPVSGDLLRRVEAVLERVEKLPALKEVDGLVIGSEPLLRFEIETVLTVDEMERQYIAYVLRRCADNRTRAAELLGIDASTLYRKLARYGTDYSGSG